MEIERERQKILDGTYPSRVVQGRQNKHIQGTREFEQKREQMKRTDPTGQPSILEVDAQALVDKYKGTGDIEILKGRTYPKENIIADEIIGKTWLRDRQKYMDTDAFRIHYSKTGVHAHPVHPKKGDGNLDIN
ncbi:MAG: polymorphic toxin type 50 domain-containing protein [Defluviitaleaceae bacterium]|nr:polymorphic toxin type 50 domain-containing protein [Defluviitaleaceae bacterium]